MGGKPCIRGMRFTVGTVVGLVAAGCSPEEILTAYPYLEAEDIPAALAYAAKPGHSLNVASTVGFFSASDFQSVASLFAASSVIAHKAPNPNSGETEPEGNRAGGRSKQRTLLQSLLRL